jgi:hypothetical protein
MLGSVQNTLPASALLTHCALLGSGFTGSAAVAGSKHDSPEAQSRPGAHWMLPLDVQLVAPRTRKAIARFMLNIVAEGLAVSN